MRYGRNISDTSLRLSHQLQLPDKAYIHREHPERFFEEEYNRHSDTKWKHTVLRYYRKEKQIYYDGWTEWMLSNYPELLI